MKKTIFIFFLLCLLSYLTWPYFKLWQLEHAVAQANPQELAPLVDLEAVRESVKRRLNKNLSGINSKASNAFVDWMQDGIRRLGNQAVDSLVTLDWVQQQLSSKTGPRESLGFLQHVDYAFFDGPGEFLVRIGKLDEDPVQLLFTFTGTGWYLTAIYN